MTAELPKDVRENGALAMPGVLCVSPTQSGRRVIHLGAAAGWMVPAGIARWERELSFVRRADMTALLAKALHATLPHEQIAPKRFGRAARAVQASPLLALSSNLVEAARKEGVRVHTVGVDRVSADFYYFAEGGDGETQRVQGNLLEMVAERLGTTTTNADIEALQASMINRLLSALSKGVVSELEVELADVLPRLSRDGTGLIGTDLESFEAQALALGTASARFETAMRKLSEALATATRGGQTQAKVPLFGEAQRETMPALEVRVQDKPLRLPECFLWTVTGDPHDEPRAEAAAKAAPRPVAAPASVQDSRAASKPEVVASPKEAKPAVVAPLQTKAESAPLPPIPQTKAEGAAPPRAEPEVAARQDSRGAAEAARPVAAAAAHPPAPVERAVDRQARTARRAISKRSPLLPLFLLLSLATSLYFLWRSLP